MHKVQRTGRARTGRRPGGWLAGPGLARPWARSAGGWLAGPAFGILIVFFILRAGFLNLLSVNYYFSLLTSVKNDYLFCSGQLFISGLNGLFFRVVQTAIYRCSNCYFLGI